MKIFIVERCGVYGHGCAGVFNTLEKAVETVDNLMEQEPDDYHTYSVYSHVVNEPTEFDSKGYGHMCDENHLVAYTKHIGTRNFDDCRKLPYEIYYENKA